MSNFAAPTRPIGSSEPYRDAVWVDGYFSEGESRLARYGVRFRGTVRFEPGDKFGILRRKNETEE